MRLTVVATGVETWVATVVATGVATWVATGGAAGETKGKTVVLIYRYLGLKLKYPK